MIVAGGRGLTTSSPPSSALLGTLLLALQLLLLLLGVPLSNGIGFEQELELYPGEVVDGLLADLFDDPRRLTVRTRRREHTRPVDPTSGPLTNPSRYERTQRRRDDLLARPITDRTVVALCGREPIAVLVRR